MPVMVRLEHTHLLRLSITYLGLDVQYSEESESRGGHGGEGFLHQQKPSGFPILRAITKAGTLGR